MRMCVCYDSMSKRLFDFKFRNTSQVYLKYNVHSSTFVFMLNH